MNVAVGPKDVTACDHRRSRAGRHITPLRIGWLDVVHLELWSTIDIASPRDGATSVVFST
jgi:hypothetical protein